MGRVGGISMLMCAVLFVTPVLYGAGIVSMHCPRAHELLHINQRTQVLQAARLSSPQVSG